jgi:UDP-glucose 4-epimerase
MVLSMVDSRGAPPRVVVTGANGFIGNALCHALADAGLTVIGTVRAAERMQRSAPYAQVSVGDIDGLTDWIGVLQNADVVIHLAALAHGNARGARGLVTSLRRVNVDGAENLACQASAAHVKRLVYVSSIKVHGEQTRGRILSVEDTPSPQEPYAISKLEAEQALRNVARQTGLQVVLVRPPLVYGPRVGGNVLRLMRWVDKGLPLPLASIDNRRSLIALDNLVNFLSLCIEHPAAAGQTFLVSDGYDLSTPELTRRIAKAMGRALRLWPLPPPLLQRLTRAAGKGEWYDKLCGSLQVDMRATSEVLGWRPRVSIDEAMSRTVDSYLRHKRSGLGV